jgi:hypothetical protein
MRLFLAGCAVVALTISGPVGCKSNDPTSGSWSLSSWNPFKSSSDAPPYPERPSQFAEPSVSPDSYAGTSPGSVVPATGTTGGIPEGYGGPVDYSTSSLSSGTATYDAPYTTPQNGYYDASPAYSGATQQIAATDPSPYADALGATSNTNPYGASPDPYSAKNYMTPPNYAESSQSQYMASLGDQPFRSQYGTGGSSNQQQGASTNPPYSPPVGGGYAGTPDYVPGQTGYNPGDTGYNPPGVAPYQPSVGSYSPPADSPYSSPSTSPQGSYGASSDTQDYTPYTPGSIKPYTRG